MCVARTWSLALPGGWLSSSERDLRKGKGPKKHHEATKGSDALLALQRRLDRLGSGRPCCALECHPDAHATPPDSREDIRCPQFVSRGRWADAWALRESTAVHSSDQPPGVRQARGSWRVERPGAAGGSKGLLPHRSWGAQPGKKRHPEQEQRRHLERRPVSPLQNFIARPLNSSEAHRPSNSPAAPCPPKPLPDPPKEVCLAKAAPTTRLHRGTSPGASGHAAASGTRLHRPLSDHRCLPTWAAPPFTISNKLFRSHNGGSDGMHPLSDSHPCHPSPLTRI